MSESHLPQKNEKIQFEIHTLMKIGNFWLKKSIFSNFGLKLAIFKNNLVFKRSQLPFEMKFHPKSKKYEIFA